jgi:LSD1 subclass zinc finger protein
MIRNPHLLRQFEREILFAEFRGSTRIERLRRCAACHTVGMAMIPPSQLDLANTPHVRSLGILACRLRHLQPPSTQ